MPTSGSAFLFHRSGSKELSLCKVIRKESHVSFDPLAEKDSTVLTIPVYEDSFMTVASLHPGIGYRSFPINSAIKQAVEYLYWKYPRRFRKRKAA